jgi:hypothetical protein
LSRRRERVLVNRCNCAMISTLTTGLTVTERLHGTYTYPFIQN